MSRKKPVVSNTSPLIYLAKIGRLDLLRRLFGEVVIPRRVYLEAASEGKTADAILILKAVEEDWVKVSDGAPKEESAILARATGMHEGEAEAILLAKALKVDIIVDEREASATAHMFGVTAMGTIAVLLLTLAEKLLTFTEFKDSLDKLLSVGFWLTVDVYNKALEVARQFTEE